MNGQAASNANASNGRLTVGGGVTSQVDAASAGVGAAMPPIGSASTASIAGAAMAGTTAMPQTPPEEKPRILVMGLRRSGKSSIQKVVFHKMSPNETLFLESTCKIQKDEVSDCSFIQFSVWDVPGHIDYLTDIFDTSDTFASTGAIVFVIDAQDDYMEAIDRLKVLVSGAYNVNPRIKFEVFIHKVDGLTDEQKIEVINIHYHLTTIYDHSIFEAFSKVVQKLIPHMGAFESLLNIFCNNSGLEKAFLFDVATKIYIATDPSPVDMQVYELCCDMIDLVVDVTTIYSEGQESDELGFSEDTCSSIRLDNSTVLLLRGVDRHLALVCVLREESMDRQGIIEYNFQRVRQGLQRVLTLKQSLSSSIAAASDSQVPGALKSVEASLSNGAALD
uniref:Ras-related GTP-binding protein D n=1 Tax=Macrostomum lignano TaxID=282301 RepID=A0A1I8HQN7_9PLAT